MIELPEGFWLRSLPAEDGENERWWLEALTKRSSKESVIHGAAGYYVQWDFNLEGCSTGKLDMSKSPLGPYDNLQLAVTVLYLRLQQGLADWT